MILKVFFLGVAAFFASLFVHQKPVTNTSSHPTWTEVPITSTPLTPTINPTPTLFQESSPTSTPQNTTINDFIYPNATIQSQSSTQVTLQSTDDPNTISSWYQQKVNSLSMGSQSIAQTNANGNIKTTMDVANGSTEINIQITKNTSDTATTIIVTVTPSNGDTNSVNSTTHVINTI